MKDLEFTGNSEYRRIYNGSQLPKADKPLIFGAHSSFGYHYISIYIAIQSIQIFLSLELQHPREPLDLSKAKNWQLLINNLILPVYQPFLDSLPQQPSRITLIRD